MRRSAATGSMAEMVTSDGWAGGGAAHWCPDLRNRAHPAPRIPS